MLLWRWVGIEGQGLIGWTRNPDIERKKISGRWKGGGVEGGKEVEWKVERRLSARWRGRGVEG